MGLRGVEGFRRPSGRAIIKVLPRKTTKEPREMTTATAFQIGTLVDINCAYSEEL
jgi:hypothetical protein